MMMNIRVGLLLLLGIIWGVQAQDDIVGYAFANVTYSGSTDLCNETECESAVDPATYWFTHYVCSNDSVNWDGNAKTFQDPLPSLNYEPVAINVTLYATFGCTTLPSGSVLVSIDDSPVNFLPSVTESTKCNCSNCALEILLQSPIYSDGWNGYRYGGLNTINIVKRPDIDICVSFANISIAYKSRTPMVANFAPFGIPVNDNVSHVEIVGTNFIPELNLTCLFVGIEAVPAIIVSEYLLRCNVPLQTTPTEVALNVTGLNNYTALVGNFSWYTQPTALSFSPTHGPIGGQDVYINGSEFFNSSSLVCKFGKDLIAATFIESTSVLCPQVAHLISNTMDVNVSISENGRSFIPLPGLYYFVSTPSTSVSPTPLPTPSMSMSTSSVPSMSPSPTTLSSEIPPYVWAAFSFLVVVVVVLLIGVVIVAVRNRIRKNAAATKWDDGSGTGSQREFGSASKFINDPSAIPIQEIKNLVQIEKGSFGVIYEATWRGTKIAVKKLPANMSQKLLNEFYQEAALMRALRHPNILQYLGISFSGNDICICMSFMEQGSLYRILHAENSTFSRSLIKSVCLDTARGMTYLHQQHPPIIHRDLKSHNLLVDKHWQVKVCDFGLSRITAQNQTMTACGTPSWTAPEVLRNERYTTKADVYGFGIVIWEMFARNDPFPGMPPFQIVFAVGTQKLRPRVDPSWPVPWVNLMTSCWNEDPEIRPTFEEVISQLETMSPPSDE